MEAIQTDVSLYMMVTGRDAQFRPYVKPAPQLLPGKDMGPEQAGETGGYSVTAFSASRAHSEMAGSREVNSENRFFYGKSGPFGKLHCKVLGNVGRLFYHSSLTTSGFPSQDISVLAPIATCKPDWLVRTFKSKLFSLIRLLSTGSRCLLLRFL